ncbi:sensor histidine kinase [Kordia algicida OT-1]|uniref:Putative transmembrane protein n=1 Tax=Kordia algicida OT-1 TaxID=391587 RepID=A9DKG4_9FLAO|nr:sensor histidine kinase [Kordia algicida]EDP98321.1 putative transmembrane protein [Kordia algicida OT-1]
MNFFNYKISKILIHILFWSLFIFVSLFYFSDYYWAENPFLQYLSILVVIVYANDFVMLPYFEKKKWYTLYILIIAVISFLATQLYCNVFAQCGCSVAKCLSDYVWQTIVPIIFFSFIWMLFRYLEKKDEVEAIKQKHTEMELKFLKSQINPHVLFNNLNTIYSYSLEKPAQVPELILMLSNNLKHVLYESNATFVSLEKELEFIDNYIKFQEIRTEGIKTISYKKDILDHNYKIAPLLLITLIENAFKHSVMNTTIDIHIVVSNGVLTCICANECDEAKSRKNQQIGLQNLKKRLELIYKNKYELTFNHGKLYIVTLKLNLS